MNDVRLAVQQCALDRREQRRSPELVVWNFGAGHRVHAERKAILGPRRQCKDVMRQRAANRFRELRKDLPDVERFCNRMKQADERVDPLAAAELGRANRVVIEGQRDQVADGFEQLLMVFGEGVCLAGCQPDGALDTCALADGAD